MQMLCCHWVRARQSGGHPAGDTVETLVHWIDADEYGYAYQMERDLAEVLDDAGRTAFVKVARARFEQAAQEATRRKDEPGGDASKRQWADVLRAVLPPLSVGEMTLRLYAALNYSQNSAHDLRRALKMERKRFSCKGIRTHHQRQTAQAPPVARGRSSRRPILLLESSYMRWIKVLIHTIHVSMVQSV